MSGVVYHFTDTARLPHILLDGLLKPGRCTVGGFPDPDFLWATSSPLGDRTASASTDAMRRGLVRLVRFTLSAEDFEPWHTIVHRFPAWTPDLVACLEQAAAGKSRPQEWWCSDETVPANRWISIETRSWTDKTWRNLPSPWRVMPLDACSAGVQIGTKVYASTAGQGRFGTTAYVPAVLDAGEGA